MGIVNKFAPQVRPQLWVYVNCFVFLYSVALFIITAFFTDDRKEVKFAKASYLYYSCITTAIWCSFVGLEIAYDHWDTHGWEKRTELIIAAVFTVSTIYELLEWHLRDQNIPFMELDILGNVIPYGLETWKHYNTWRDARKGYETVEESNETPPATIE